MTIRFNGKIIKTNHMLISELLYLFENLKFQPQVSNIPTALACSSKECSHGLCFLGLVTKCTLKFKFFKNLNSLHEIHVQKSEKRPAVPFDYSYYHSVCIDD